MTLDTEALSALRKDAEQGGQYQTFARRRRRRALLLAVGAIAVLAVLWIARRGPLPVEIAVIEPATDTGGLAVLNASGYVTARRLATVSSKVTGKVAELLFEEGARVEQHQVLARLDDATVRAQLDIAARERDAAVKALAEIEVRLADAIRNRDRARALRPQNLVSQSALDAAEAEAAALAARLEATRAGLAVAEAALRLRRQELDDLEIRAPFTGVIVSKDAQPGEMVSPISAGGGFTRTGIATIVDMESREIEVDVNEAYINRVAAGQRVGAVLDAYPEWTLPARVTAIVPTADRQKATVRVRIGFEQLDPRILPDMGVKVRFFDDSRATRVARGLVPAAAVVEADGRSYLWRVKDGRAARVEVRLADEQSGMRPVLAGAGAGDAVIVGPPVDLEDGTRVMARDSG
jgi:RND family efflux transporter MFP subunit